MSVDRSTAPPPSPATPCRFPDFSVEPVGRGTAYLLRRTTLPLTHLEIVSRWGADTERRGFRGLATLGANLLDEGTPGRTSQQIAAAAEALGTEIQTQADWDGTYVALTVRSENALPALDLALELFDEADFPEREVERVKRRRLAELRRRSTRPDFLAARELLRAIYPGHVYGESLLGLSADVEATDRESVIEWAAGLRGAPLAAIVTGEADGEAVLARLDGRRAGPARGVDSSLPPAAPARAGREIVIVDRPQARQTELRIGHAGIARVDPDRIPAQVLNCVLGGKFTSRLNLSLREGMGVTYGAWSRFSPRRGTGPFVAGAAVETEAVGRAAAEVLAQMRRLREEEVPAAELADARSYLVGTFPYSLQTLEGLAGRLEDLALHPTLPRDTYRRWPEQVDAVDAPAVRGVARRLLFPDEAVVVAVGPAAEIEPRLSELGPVRVVPTGAV